jgi:uncharacterized membrane protein YcaP (DUF421 family)
MGAAPELGSLGSQSLLALLYYFTVIVIVRLAGKRLAGQMTTFDLVVLIGLVVAAQQSILKPGPAHAAAFVITVLVTHITVTWLCGHYRAVRHLLRGRPRALVRNGVIIDRALAEEGVSVDELLAGLRKLGFESPAKVKLAVLEETGHVSAIAADEGNT